MVLPVWGSPCTAVWKWISCSFRLYNSEMLSFTTTPHHWPVTRWMDGYYLVPARSLTTSAEAQCLKCCGALRWSVAVPYWRKRLYQASNPGLAGTTSPKGVEYHPCGLIWGPLWCQSGKMTKLAAKRSLCDAFRPELHGWSGGMWMLHRCLPAV